MVCCLACLPPCVSCFLFNVKATGCCFCIGVALVLARVYELRSKIIRSRISSQCELIPLWLQGLLKGPVSMDKKEIKTPMEEVPAAIAQVSTAEDKTKVGWVRPELGCLKV